MRFAKSTKLESCVTCSGMLRGKQRRFCSRACKNANTNFRHQNYVAQRNRGIKRKLAFIAQRGGKCKLCGYAKNYAAMVWHHRDASQKAFELDVRAMSNRKLDTLKSEVRKCDLLCSNCHLEVHNPSSML